MEVEKVLRSHPGVEDCAVVKRHDQISGEHPSAYIVKSSQYRQLTSAEIRQHVSGTNLSRLTNLRPVKQDRNTSYRYSSSLLNQKIS